MRKVMYSLNKLDQEIKADRPGIFHCWAGTMQDAYAIIEDTTTGYISRRDDNQFRFVQPPETKTHSKETARVEIVNAEDIGKRVMEVIAPVLESINRKLMSL